MFVSSDGSYSLDSTPLSTTMASSSSGGSPQRPPLSQERQEELLSFLEMLGLSEPRCLAYYDEALTHSSYTYELGVSPYKNYERLEFLGDAVLKLVISDYLYRRFPDYREGGLTKIRAVVVSDAELAKIAHKMDLGLYMVFGANEARSGGAQKPSNLACALEALIGAIYLDGKFEELSDLLGELMEDVITEVDMSKAKANYKALLQEYTQAEGQGLPDYATVAEKGPSHRKVFHIQVSVDGEALGFGEGATKKEAQQAAARLALVALNQLKETDT
jgi:ribonuclease III